MEGHGEVVGSRGGLGRGGGGRRRVVDGAEDMEHGGGDGAGFASCVIVARVPPCHLSCCCFLL